MINCFLNERNIKMDLFTDVKHAATIVAQSDKRSKTKDDEDVEDNSWKY